MSRSIITEITTRKDFLELLQHNTGVLIIKFSAHWCKPCTQIQSLVYSNFAQCDDKIICCDLNVDNNVDLYSYMKHIKQVNGIPVLLAWYKGNTSPYPNISVTGAHVNNINNFFRTCNEYATQFRL